MKRYGKLLSLPAMVLVVAIVGAACSSNNTTGGSSGAFQGAPLTGAGSTFAAPMYQQWSHSFLSVEPSAQVNYQAIGSGGGITQFTAKTVNFGASDVPLQAQEVSALTDKNYIQFPTMLGAVVFVYNLPGVQSGLKLDGPTIADIFLGKITNWNNSAITGQNPGVNLPNLPIKVVHRADESGTTSVWTTWLTKESDEWNSKVGAGKAVEWPVGIGGNGNQGVAAAAAQTQGSAAYLSYDFAVSAHLGIAAIKAPDGSYVAPSTDSITAAAGGLAFPIQSDTNILNSSASGAYPVSSTTYVLIYTDQTDQSKAQALVDFWTWALTTGQSETTAINYSPLPTDFAKSALQELSKITVNGQPVKASPAVTG